VGGTRWSLAQIATTNKMLYRAYLLKEQLREVFRVNGRDGRDAPIAMALLTPPASAHNRPDSMKPDPRKCQ
jgi:hypothetical protein